MNILLRRRWYTDQSTMGELFLDLAWECYTLEDVVRETKIQGETAIPRGRYRVIIDHSARFKRLMPRLLDVPNFDGIRIHAGNTCADTAGCILVGMDRWIDRMDRSRMAFHELYKKLEEALETEEVWIEVK